MIIAPQLGVSRRAFAARPRPRLPAVPLLWPAGFPWHNTYKFIQEILQINSREHEQSNSELPGDDEQIFVYIRAKFFLENDHLYFSRDKVFERAPTSAWPS